MAKKFNKLQWVAVGLAILQGFNGLSAVVGGFQLMNDPSGTAIGMELDWLFFQLFNSRHCAICLKWHRKFCRVMVYR